MGKVQLFDFKGQQIRVVEIDGNPWFIATDVRKVLGVSQAGSNFTFLAEDEVMRIPRGFSSGKGGGTANILSESGLYKFALRSNKQAAKPFQDWVTKVVLPAIRKDGAYVMGEEKVATGEMSEDELVLKAFGIMQRKLERLTAEKAALQHKVDHLTIRQFESDLGVYTTQAQKNRMAAMAKGYCAAKDLPIRKEPMQLPEWNGGTREVFVNVYPRKALEYAADILGLGGQ